MGKREGLSMRDWERSLAHGTIMVKEKTMRLRLGGPRRRKKQWLSSALQFVSNGLKCPEFFVQSKEHCSSESFRYSFMTK
jgi:hypothetical protein